MASRERRARVRHVAVLRAFPKHGRGWPSGRFMRKCRAEMLKANPPGGSAITINSIEVGEVVERA